MADGVAATLQTADLLDEIARRVDRLSVSRRDPEAFFEERSEIVHMIRSEAVKLRCTRPKRRAVDTGGR